MPGSFCFVVNSFASSGQGIYLISDGGYLRKRGALLNAIESALNGAQGAIKFVQLREQNPQAAKQAAVAPASDNELLDLARALKPVCARHGAKLLINRRIDLAKEAGVDGVHIGKGGPTLAEAKAELGALASVGYSAHSVDELEKIEKEPYSYALLSPIFKPFSKNIDLNPLGVKYLHEACSRSALPIFALGGITKENAALCFRAGAAGVAAISSILLAPDPAKQAGAFAELCAGAAPPAG